MNKTLREILFSDSQKQWWLVAKISEGTAPENS
jgi:hypothetical protein